jgi:hypothetical protein
VLASFTAVRELSRTPSYTGAVIGDPRHRRRSKAYCWRRLAGASVPVSAAISLAVLANAVLVAPLVPTASATGLSPALAVAAAISAGESEPSVHWVTTGSSGGTSTTLSTDAGRSSGWQTVTYTAATEGGTEQAELTIELVDGAGYMIGNAEGLYVEGLTTAESTDEAGKWISIPVSSPIYQPSIDGLTIKTTMKELQMSGAVTAKAPVRINGHRDLGYEGKTKPAQGQPSIPETLYVGSIGSHLPVKVVETGATTVFSEWGTAISVTKPTGPITLRSSWLRRA